MKLIVKKRKVPLAVRKLRALACRLPPNHPKVPIIMNDLKKREAGYKGECSIDFPLSFLEPKSYFIFHDLRLQDQSRFFQLDTLLISKKYALIIEVKNIAGSIYFDPHFNQLIRTIEGKETAFPDPVTQVSRQESQLTNWFLKNGFPSLPILSLIVISNPQTIIRTALENHELHYKVIHRDALPAKINQMEHSITESSFSEKNLKKAIRVMNNHHIDADFSILKRYNLTEKDLIKGVICENCKGNKLFRRHGTWLCNQCQLSSKKAHIPALRDYYYLLGSTITNRQLRNFLNISSSSSATRILQSLNLTSSGANKGRVYSLYFDE
ncbi:NERD domain-containing protein [Peribacillus frigoritolerans]|uniref:nuclease-related domain-containing protein n=1 Tax=Peribacillus frigoritolerans TaxID=450367 RepID=UPI00209DC360|nr:nuclease-related domain-containing protein [Peribacillus frigoritolerans]MCP1095759.1 NERD domain-containing protein [Bacillaceae bacterium OS4b]MCP1155610.1 NERD domain-containing protein [Peribacillus frigoritolerans]MCT1388196.1 NERD domain-containing protein [Peribacillus frigoritolerans]